MAKRAKKEKDVLLDHDYDGIRELDNDLPPWWLYMFYLTVIWGVGYFLYFHVFGIGDSSYAEYQKELDPGWAAETPAKSGFTLLKSYHSPYYNPDGDLTPRTRLEQILAEEKRRDEELKAEKLAALESGENGKSDVSTMSFDDLIKAAMVKADSSALIKLKEAFPDLYASLDAKESVSADAEIAGPAEAEIAALTDIKSLASGESVFSANCASCHGNKGQGGIGPNLTDDYWIHGAGMNNVVKIINVGVPAKGMISWERTLNQDQIMHVASYILTLHGTNPPNAKAPQGDKVEVE
ncbi:MAG: cbb3-type cytochrome c oxidase N-terminal domain-containing protein [Calditrichaceae bacterium]